ncbi:hypothetical protein JCM8547_008876 [Rhodosporidiobolus lusitaniae]
MAASTSPPRDLPSPPLLLQTQASKETGLVLSWLCCAVVLLAAFVLLVHALRPTSLLAASLPASSVLSILFFTKLARSSFPLTQSFPVRLKVATDLTGLVQAWMIGWTVLEVAWTRDERGEVRRGKEARRVAMGVVAATATLSYYLVRSARSFCRLFRLNSRALLTAQTAIRRVVDENATGRRTEAYVGGVMWRAVEIAVEEAKRVGGEFARASLSYHRLLILTYFFLFCLSLLSLHLCLSSHSSLTLLLSNLQRRTNLSLSPHMRSPSSFPGTREDIALRDLRNRTGSGMGERERERVEERKREVRWAAGLATISALSSLSLALATWWSFSSGAGDPWLAKSWSSCVLLPSPPPSPPSLDMGKR